MPRASTSSRSCSTPSGSRTSSTSSATTSRTSWAPSGRSSRRSWGRNHDDQRSRRWRAQFPWPPGTRSHGCADTRDPHAATQTGITLVAVRELRPLQPVQAAVQEAAAWLAAGALSGHERDANVPTKDGAPLRLGGFSWPSPSPRDRAVRCSSACLLGLGLQLPAWSAQDRDNFRAAGLRPGMELVFLFVMHSEVWFRRFCPA
mmetsp:Transcript_26247/g.59719  ORF Transcript_26247/g.59719 Transcript_26247/m.59719 type:complete len:203 (+) Transcript_26247:592-1200(+)